MVFSGLPSFAECWFFRGFRFREIKDIRGSSGMSGGLFIIDCVFGFYGLAELSNGGVRYHDTG
jgi:hypothetical protein